MLDMQSKIIKTFIFTWKIIIISQGLFIFDNKDIGL